MGRYLLCLTLLAERPLIAQISRTYPTFAFPSLARNVDQQQQKCRN
jgi:hypothetical protein